MFPPASAEPRRERLTGTGRTEEVRIAEGLQALARVDLAALIADAETGGDLALSEQLEDIANLMLDVCDLLSQRRQRLNAFLYPAVEGDA